MAAELITSRWGAAVAGNGTGLAGIEAIVERMVEQRVRATVTRAVRVLEGAAGELRGM
jgi:hypothetical protein